jgi:hypothetical protein
MKKFVYIKKSDSIKWYNIGEKYEVSDEPIFLSGKYKYVYDNTHVINMEDCFSENEIRGKKLERIV